MVRIQNLTKRLSNETAMLAFGAQLAKVVTAPAILFLYGELGAGKTTLARGFLRGLGYEGKVKSPTYTLVEPYDLETSKVFHFDFYRLQDASELAHIGIQEYFSKTFICLIEWPEKGHALLPGPDLACYISMVDEGREIRLIAKTERGEKILERL